MRHNFRISSIIGCLALMALAVGIAGAQHPGPRGEAGAQSETSAQAALGTAFTYQGHLTDSGSPANGAYDFRFRLFDMPAGGKSDTPIVKDDVAVTNGLFSVELDFGGNAFTGNARYLEIEVRPGSSDGAYTTLSPRQALTAAPYALGLRPGARISGAPTLSGAPAPVLRADNTALSGAADGIWGATASPSGYGGYFSNPAAVSGSALYVDGDAKQSLSGDGLVKAGAFVACAGGAAGSSTVLHSFNNVNTTAITITNGSGVGQCSVDFGFDVSNRYIVATAQWDQVSGMDAPRAVAYRLSGAAASSSTIRFFRFDPSDGTGANGEIMVLNETKKIMHF